MRTWILIIPLSLFLLISCATMSWQARQNEADAHFKLAISDLDRGQMQAAFVELQKSIELNPGNKRVHNALGIVYRYFGNTKKAEEAFKAAIRIDPQYSEAYNNLGVGYMKTMQWDKAIKAFRKALDNLLYPTPETAFTNLGKVYYRRGELDKSIRAYKKAIKRAPSYNAPYYGLALCYNAQARYGDAAEALTEAIKLDSVFKGDREKAKQELTRQKLKAIDKGEEQDYINLLDILHY
ncbi:MAG TPA: tetratricopeptide repeat protein [Nitrospirae bacterium]|nr:tetratricopeptide repeat protein [Nitrospirota bacterium]